MTLDDMILWKEGYNSLSYFDPPTQRFLVTNICPLCLEKIMKDSVKSVVDILHKLAPHKDTEGLLKKAHEEKKTDEEILKLVVNSLHDWLRSGD